VLTHPKALRCSALSSASGKEGKEKIELRKQQTPADDILWGHLRNRRFSAHKFLRQHPVCVSSVFGKNLYYIPDLYCHKAKLVIEADGPIHLFKKEYDKNRDEVLTGLGLTILRFTF